MKAGPHENLTAIKQDIKEICKTAKQCHSSHHIMCFGKHGYSSGKKYIYININIFIQTYKYMWYEHIYIFNNMLHVFANSLYSVFNYM